jgi:hypothetical protein
MKKALTLSLLLLANITLLAHSTIPHHYHNGIPVTVSGIYDVDTEEAHVHDYRHHHHEPNNATVEDCLLDKVCLRADNSNLLLNASSVYNAFPLLCLPLLASVCADRPTDLSPLPFAQKPYTQSYHTTFIAHSLGLRAPPIGNFELRIKN